MPEPFTDHAEEDTVRHQRENGSAIAERVSRLERDHERIHKRQDSIHERLDGIRDQQIAQVSALVKLTSTLEKDQIERRQALWLKPYVQLATFAWIVIAAAIAWAAWHASKGGG